MSIIPSRESAKKPLASLPLKPPTIATVLSVPHPNTLQYQQQSKQSKPQYVQGPKNKTGKNSFEDNRILAKIAVGVMIKGTLLLV
ncbi:hypothetical protein GcC1_037032 [Golovinomyces cichoracearum]|uniref:Uncharacterized protein n=1 Tax=Golovinomyces cichoracearum TaxID=62708 RepID=A0A420J0V0_9PEZI|nr:hypothetical protein GcC1_037032 [Golovinomyces cichoracearum]